MNPVSLIKSLHPHHICVLISLSFLFFVMILLHHWKLTPVISLLLPPFCLLFLVQAMHLVCKALEKEPTPQTLPANMMPPSKRKKPSALPGAVGVLPSVVPMKPLNTTPPAATGGLLGTEMLRPASPAGVSTLWRTSYIYYKSSCPTPTLLMYTADQMLTVLEIRSLSGRMVGYSNNIFSPF